MSESKYEDEARGRGVPEDWVEFFARLWKWVEEVTEKGHINSMAPDGQPRLAVNINDLRVLLAKAEEGVVAGHRADAAINEALVSAAKSEERMKETLRLQGTLQERLDQVYADAMERACAAVCERCRDHGPAVWSIEGALHEPGHPEFDPEDGQWWHNPGGQDEGWCAAQQIRVAFNQEKGCLRRPGVECECPMCQTAVDRLAKEGPHGRSSCNACGGYHVRIVLTRGPHGWMGCVGCGNGEDLPAEISLDSLEGRHDGVTQGVDKK